MQKLSSMVEGLIHMTGIIDRLLDEAEKAQRKGHLVLAQVLRDASDQIARDATQAETTRASHDQRVTELLEANNREVERRRDAERDRAKAQAVLDGKWEELTQIQLQELHAVAGKGGEALIQAGMIPVVAAFLVADFKAQGATNYAAFEINHTELGPLLLTMQRRWGKQPHQVAAEERARAERAEAALREARLERDAWFQAAAHSIVAEEDAKMQQGTVYRHVKRGGLYHVIGDGTAQGPIPDMEPVTIYRSEDGRIWVRGTAEFTDGRFVPAPAASADDAHALVHPATPLEASP